MSKTPTALIRMVFAAICFVGLAAAATALFPATASAQQLRRCAREGGICRLPYPAEVVYGARGRTTSRFFGRRAVPCSNRVFGDPAPGREKACYFVARGRGDYGGDNNYGDNNYGDDEYGSRPDRGEWVACAREGEFCDFRGRAVVRYGARGRYAQDVFRNGVDCSNDTFGDDPAPGAHKNCYIRQ
ncbi:hypothetical protein [Mesorhizobium australafricanum]|uniref:Uncharacterized protein n=1 Tax=Mesorhizobium australafricanum TaxID=3072311 RepID=A0ABU4X0Y9_9HYPH|nr:hypothetical protein [Mesorhizobium sp. VK3E]MDX8441988.1 hypothetical protein [Mesorhizobium sp. VK3E]